MQISQDQSKVQIPEYLSASTVKRQVYSEDSYFLKAWHDSQRVLQARIHSLVTDWSFILFKSESVVGRKIAAGLDYLTERGFRPIAFSTVTFDHRMIRAVWRYQLNVATAERLKIIEMLATSAPSLFVLLKDLQPEPMITASERLSRLKGPSPVKQRKPHQLRFRLGCQSDFFNYVHSPREPADLVREIGIFFSEPEREALLRAALHEKDCSSSVKEEEFKLYSTFLEHDLSADSALQRIGTACAYMPAATEEEFRVRTELMRRCESLRTASNEESNELFTIMESAGVEINVWDRIVISAQKAGPNLPGIKPMLD